MTSPRTLAARLLVVGFHGGTLPAWVSDGLAAGLAGVVLFKRNISSAEQVSTLVRQVREAAPAALVCVDQEGGRVQRLGPPAGFTRWPAARAVAEHGTPQEAGVAAAAMGRELRAAGFDLSFAPVLDVDTNPDNPVIGDRSYARDPEQVARYGVAVAAGLESAGIIACGKHFPGHGDTDLDSHLALPVVDHDLRRLRTVEWVPFAAVARAGIPMMMTAHVLVRALDDAHPATLSEAALRPLRQELGFEGCIVSDDMEMKAVRERYAPGEAALRAVRAGVDLLLVCSREDDAGAAWDALTHEADSDAGRARMEEAAARVTALRERVPPAMPLTGDALRRELRQPDTLALAARLTGGRA